MRRSGLSVIETIYMAIVFAVSFVVLVMFTQTKIDRRQSEAKEAAASHLSESLFRRFPAYRDKTAIKSDAMTLIIDVEARKTLVGFSAGLTREIPFDNFIGARIVTDGKSLLTTERTGPLAPSMMGGALETGTGAVIGAQRVGGLPDARRVTTSIAVQLSTNDSQVPMLEWVLFKPAAGMRHLEENEVSSHLEQAHRLYNAFSPIFESDRA